MTFETLAAERVHGELVMLTRRGSEYRVVSVPDGRLRSLENAARWTFRSAEVAWRAFDFVVATERLWCADGCAPRTILRALAGRAGLAFRAAALRHGDPVATALLHALDGAT